MKKASIDFSSMVPTIVFEESVISELLLISRQKKSIQLVLIAQVIVKNSKIEFHCSTLITDTESEISVREDEVPIYVDILPESQFQQPDNIEIEDFQKNFYKMMEETSNQYNANNIYSLISDVAFMNNQLNVRISLFCPKSSIEIEEIDSSDVPSVCSIPGATYRFPKDKKHKDPNSIYAIYYGINGIKDPRIYSLSYSIYLQQHKKIAAAFNNKLYRITFHENDEFELLTTTFSVSKASSITARFNYLPQTNEEVYIDLPKPSNQFPNEIYEHIKSMKKEISNLRTIISEQGKQLESKIEEHDEEIKTMLQTILNEIQKPRSVERSNSKSFLHRQICRKPVIPLEISVTASFETQQSSADYLYAQVPQQQQVHQQPLEIKQQQKQHSRMPVENPNLQVLQQASNGQNQPQNPLQNQNKLFTSNPSIPTNTASHEKNQSAERQRPKCSVDSKTSFEKRRSASKETLNTSAPSIQSTRRNQQISNAPTSTNSVDTNSSINNINTSLISNINTITSSNRNNGNNNSKVNLTNIKYGTSNNSRGNKQSIINIENRSDNDDFASKYSKQSTKFSNQLFNEPSFDISAQIPDSLNESPNKRENVNVPSDLSFLLNNDASMDTNKFFEVIGISKTPNQ